MRKIDSGIILSIICLGIFWGVVGYALLKLRY